MRNLFIIFTLLTISHFVTAQERFVEADYTAYYEWFNAHSQTASLYEQGTQLLVFGHDVNIFDGPCETASVVTQVTMGQKVRNLVDYVEAIYVPEDELNGYGDIWYQVGGKDKHGKKFSGYLWGGHIAKAWTMHDFTGDNRKELVMLGVSPAPKRTVTDIKAEIRVLQGGNLLYQKTVPGLCVFEDCGAAVLLRVLPDTPVKGSFMLEASTMTISCFAGIEKAFYSWDGQRLNTAYHAEYTTQRQFTNKPFRSTISNGATQLCRYSHEDKNFNPVWTCTDIETADPSDQVKPKAVVVDRAR